MTPHDVELKQFNNIMNRLELIELNLFRVMDDASYKDIPKNMQDSIYVSIVFLKDAKDKLMKYGERQ